MVGSKVRLRVEGIGRPRLVKIAVLMNKDMWKDMPNKEKLLLAPFFERDVANMEL